jgi:hypothetical protein
MGMLLGGMGGMSFTGVSLILIIMSSGGVWGAIWLVVVEGAPVGRRPILRSRVRMGVGFGTGIAGERSSQEMELRMIQCLLLRALSMALHLELIMAEWEAPNPGIQTCNAVRRFRI